MIFLIDHKSLATLKNEVFLSENTKNHIFGECVIVT